MEQKHHSRTLLSGAPLGPRRASPPSVSSQARRFRADGRTRAHTSPDGEPFGPMYPTAPRPLSRQGPSREKSVATCATLASMQRSVSVRELRNTVSEVLRAVEGGERVTVTVDRRPVAELTPLVRRRTVTLDKARWVASRHAADRRLLGELNEVFPDTTDDL